MPCTIQLCINSRRPVFCWKWAQWSVLLLLLLLPILLLLILLIYEHFKLYPAHLYIFYILKADFHDVFLAIQANDPAHVQLRPCSCAAASLLMCSGVPAHVQRRPCSYATASLLICSGDPAHMQRRPCSYAAASLLICSGVPAHM